MSSETPRLREANEAHINDANRMLSTGGTVAPMTVRGLLSEIYRLYGALDSLTHTSRQQEQDLQKAREKRDEMAEAWHQLKQENDLLKTEGSPGVMHDIDRSFYELTVKERDYERVKVDRLEREVQELKRQVELGVGLVQDKEAAAQQERESLNNVLRQRNEARTRRDELESIVQWAKAEVQLAIYNAANALPSAFDSPPEPVVDAEKLLAILDGAVPLGKSEVVIDIKESE